MTLKELIAFVARLLTSRSLRYFVFGGVGVSVWGRPRTTHDLDLVIQLDRPAVSALVADLKKAGFKIARSEERKLREGRLLRLPIGSTELNFRLSGKDDLGALDRAKVARVRDYELWVASPEDLVLYKLQSWRLQDRADIENLLTHVKDLDRRYIGKQLPAVEKSTGLPMLERWRETLRAK